jgi:hypothetical protein
MSITSLTSSLVALKILLGLSLLSYSALRQAGMEEREAEDQINDFGRSAVGERKEEAVSPVLRLDLMSRNTIREQANTYRKMMIIYHILLLSPSAHLLFRTPSMRALRNL